MNEMRVKIIKAYIGEIKKCIGSGKWRFEHYRPKNAKFLQEHGMDLDDVKEILLDLNYEHYHNGPEADRDITKKGEVWFFIYPFDDILIYIKVRVEVSVEVVCISFHEEGDF